MRHNLITACLLLPSTALGQATSTLPHTTTPEPKAVYRQHQDLMIVRDDAGVLRRVRSQRDWQIRRRHVLDGLQQVMGKLPDRSSRVPLDVRTIETVRLGVITRRKLTFRSDRTGRVSAYLFLPAKPPATSRHPAVLCLQQTNRAGKLEAAGLSGNPELAHAVHLARRGYVTLAADYPGFGESTYDFGRRHGYASGTMKAIWDNIRAVDLLTSLDVVDPDRIGVIGHSLGGHNAMFTAAFEPRLRVIISNCGFTRFHKDDVPSWTGPRYMPRIRTRFRNHADSLPFDFPEIIGTFAPRPFLAIAAQGDRDFDYTGVLDSIDAARPVYGLYAARDRLQAAYPNIGHSFPATSRDLADHFLDRHLDHSPTPER